ncbi:MAG TPA: hypothetical protein ENN87_08365 [Phycisphaerales bacterium]|nr:hypothetical protein [Phycisphaerales bacterium]
MDVLKLLYDYFPTAVYTGKCLLFISEDWRVELTELKDANFCTIGSTMPTIRVRLFKKAVDGQFVPGHYEDFQLDSLGELAQQIERYVQFAVGHNTHEGV